MADYRPPLDDIRFVLKYQLETERLWRSMPALDDVDMETADAILEEAGKLVKGAIAPLNREADELGCQFDNGEVVSPEGFKKAYQLFCDGGWGALSGNPEYGGMGMPKSLVAAVEEMVQGSCMAFGLAPMLTSGACLALDAHATDELKATYLEYLYSGEWSGAMDLTEPHAGTDLGLIRTRAELASDGSYRVTGTKIFITWGEHDLAANIVHLVLAKLPDAPAGSRGISLFLVPKFLPDSNGSVGERNAVHCGSLEKKMGIKASPTCVMNFDGATGWLVGEPNNGLAAMFTMMNYERLAVGIQGVGVAEVSYQNAVEYARDRLQSRSPCGVKQPESPADPILVHPDVRRMLMTMRSLNEGGRAFYLYVAQWLDEAKFSEDSTAKVLAGKMVALLTPIAKAFLTDRAFDAAVLGQQVFGGHGYIREWGQEQHVRDIRITQIYEGTNGIQAMDLIGRKTLATKGELLDLFLDEVTRFMDGLEADDRLQDMITALTAAMNTARRSTANIILQAGRDPNAIGAAAVDYLNLLGYICFGYMWLRAAAAAQNAENKSFAEAKQQTARFFFQRLLPEVELLAVRIEVGADSLMALPDDSF
ncbi:acyl-CoA dehydrogenase C-terminal domain-containing protein [Teredinibacter haidensis]|uniref:acyl-CoA dehydrogenase C-terminal domain-containing protein n=1 Tax=Teredinibacter haidensis TaxID=2731755 RepID=UPI000948FCD5|nr:acyl-CoA dehydrogenase C-terminal domain-containing protein [Teredinibacter haidensis]